MIPTTAATQILTLSGLRQLDRPGIVTLRQSGQSSGLVLVTALTGDTATLQSGEQRWRMPLATLAGNWRGDFATLWRTPPGLHAGLVIAAGRRGLCCRPGRGSVCAGAGA